jgi:cytochrome c peroxidase
VKRLFALVVIALCAAPPHPAALAESRAGARFEWRLPAGFPLPIAGLNEQTQAKFELGRRLFYDRRLSFNGTQSCADCHQQQFAFSDGRVRAIGSTGQEHSRNSMSLTNAAYNAAYTWDNASIRTLEQQALIPMFNDHPIELGVRNHEKEIVARLKSDPAYDAMFRDIFHGERKPVSLRNVARALASFERALISGHSPYDRFVYGGDEEALTPAAWRGMQVFFSSRAGCSSCHRGFNFSGEARYAGRNIGAAHLISNGVTRGRFRVPTLRNIALTGPYMHDGSIATLDGVLDSYAQARKLPLSCEDKEDLIAFLDALTDLDFVTDSRFSAPR